MLEGVRLVSEACASDVPLRLALYAAEQLQQTAAGRVLLQRFADQPHWHAASARVVAAAADTVSPQGIIAVADWPERRAGDGLVLVLDAVQDPGNVGSLLRSAEAAGVAQVVCSQGTADVYSPKVVRAAMGAHFWLPLRIDVAWPELAILLNDMQHMYAAVGGAQQPYYAVDWQGNTALIIGNEAQGVSADALALAVQQIAIPMQGRAESLNAAVAGSIILFEALRQRAQAREQDKETQ